MVAYASRVSHDTIEHRRRIASATVRRSGCAETTAPTRSLYNDTLFHVLFRAICIHFFEIRERKLLELAFTVG